MVFRLPLAIMLLGILQSPVPSHASRLQEAEDSRVLYSQGQTALQNGDLEAAERAFRKVIAIDPSVAGAYSNLGVIAMRRKDWDHALTWLQTAATLAPNGRCVTRVTSP